VRRVDDHNRKLWMFCYDKVGAQARANLFSLVMTARANAVEPFENLSEMFEQLPAATTVEAIEALLPWNLEPVLDAQRRSAESCCLRLKSRCCRAQTASCTASTGQVVLHCTSKVPLITEDQRPWVDARSLGLRLMSISADGQGPR
jgi:hypothetical protein